jgi:hypothetical protein
LQLAKALELTVVLYASLSAHDTSLTLLNDN